MASISDLLTPREDVEEGRFQGVLQAHKVGSSDQRLENDPRRLLSMTYPSNALQTAFDHVDNKLRGRDSQGGVTLSGPYGAGKSHALLALYHLFDSPALAQDWLDEWGIPLDLPDSARASILSTSRTDADRLWEPVFRDLGREDVLDDVKRYPTTDHIEELASGEPVAIFLDEIETWWESFGDSADGELLERNEFFLQNLFEVANDPDYDLFAFVTLLDKSEDLKRILDRTSPYAVDLDATGDRERIVLHRLFETRREDLDESAVRDVVREYVEDYSYPIEIDAEKRYEDRMVATYPFHPELLDLLDSLSVGGRERQNVRGAMNVLADTVYRLHDETDLVITCDVEAAAFRGLDQTLFDRYRSDLDAVEDLDFGEELLTVVLLYTLDERRREASVTECLVGTYRPEKTSVSKLDMSLGDLYGTAHYLDRDSSKGNYAITENPRLAALVTREQERVLDGDRDAVEEKLAEVVRDDVWDGDVSVYPGEEIPDSEETQFVVTLDCLSSRSLRSELDDCFEGRTYQNTVLFVTPRQEIREDDDVLGKAARVLAAENLQGRVDDGSAELGNVIRDERRELRSELEDRYGNWIKWSEDPNGGVRIRRKTVVADVEDVKNEVGRDTTYVGEKILDEVRDAENGIALCSMLNDFRQFRRLPVLLDEEVFASAVDELFRDGRIVLEGDRGEFYAAHEGDTPPALEDGLTIHGPGNLDEPVDTTTGGGSSGEKTTTGGSEGGDSGATAVATQTETERVTLEGPSARVLRSHAESRINGGTDTATHIDLSCDVDGLSKEELVEFIEQLPSANHIEAAVVVERDV